MLEKNQIIALVILVTLVISIVIWLYLTIRSIRLAKRIENFVVVNDDLETISLFDKLIGFGNSIIDKGVKKLKEWKLDKILYNKKLHENINDKLRFIVIRVLTGFTFLFFYIIFSLFGVASFSLILMLLSFMIGLCVPSFIYYVRDKMIKKQIEKDLLKAVSLMNNSFQAGKSIIQSVQNVSKELDGPLANEFDKMYHDMLHGLSFQVAFNRFYDRVKLEEIKYITSALLILNQTGGNIMKVFSSIEKGFYTRRKLDMELKSAIASSKLVFQVLIFMPFLLWIVIGLWNPTYFSVFFESTIGMLLFTIILCIYLIYIIVVRSIMKIEKY